MTDFFAQPILNSPYQAPREYWELDSERRPTGKKITGRRPAQYITAVPAAKISGQARLTLHETITSDGGQEYDPMPVIDEIRSHLDKWRRLPVEQCGVTPVTVQLLRHWREHDFLGRRPFFCQIEAAETIIWLTEVAGCISGRGPSAYKGIREHLRGANEHANPGLLRIALKLATGAGKTTVMAMLIAWQTLNALRSANSPRFTRGFLVVTPGITIRDRLRVLLPNDPDSYYVKHDLVPHGMRPDMQRAKIVITNYHAFLRRERTKLAKGNRALLKGHGPEVSTLETEGQMLQRVCRELMGLKNILVLNDEAHHCYREKPGESEEDAQKGDEREEAKKNVEAARVWIAGIEAVQSQIGVRSVLDLSATPFFLSGSGYREGTLFPWTASDFSLLEAIECGIVKLPRVPVADNAGMAEMPRYRELWRHIGPNMPKKNSAKTGQLDPLGLPKDLRGAIDALYGHYAATFEAWQEAEIEVPPVFIVVCNNMAASELVYRFMAGFERAAENGAQLPPHRGLPLFSNYDEAGQRLARPRTLLINSEQLESGEALDKTFRAAHAEEIVRFRRERVERERDSAAGESLTDADLLREVMNTVGKSGRLGGDIRCVVSVAMLSEGWDANTVTHVLGVRAFGTQLLCEQVVGRALRRQSYELNEKGLFDVEYADVLGVPFDFAAEPIVVTPIKPKRTVHVHAVQPERDKLAIEFPRVEGYAYELPEDHLTAEFNHDSTLTLTPEKVGPTQTHTKGILGEGAILTPSDLQAARPATVAFHLAKRLLEKHFRGANGLPKMHLMGDLLRIARQWLDGGHLVCRGGTRPAQLLYAVLADDACERIHAGIARSAGERQIRAVLDPYNPHGSTAEVDFRTSRQTRWSTNPALCHVNWAVCDGGWEIEFCRILESHPRVRAYVKNEGMGFSVPYRMGGIARRYFPDFIARLDDGVDEPMNLVVEIKGKREDDAIIKAETMRTSWVPGVNQLAEFGRWDFLELTNIETMEEDFHRWFAQHARCPAVRATHHAILLGGSMPYLQDIPRRRSEAV
ncbi:MAG: DEAD/DEAH box helicase family protein [Gammaproteobacteria bacterium]|nr:DEAD/DEAH box helicase family protein [Gammaproteobacteria bacterium]MXW46373.1 restriction endonuclease [Gammaproteobacteria bacterium]MYD01242.1 restriction endonuclease [Gammaproteobacteria bacterium]MYI26372.1 restriction endonuclease [Gammaproteobacteria bacterium]